MKKLKRRSCQIACCRGRKRSSSSNHTDQDILLRSPSPCRLNFSTSRDTLTYAQSQKMVEVELEGRVHRINISEPLKVITEDEMLAQDLAEFNSNKENSEQITSYAQRDNTVSLPKDRRKDNKHSGKIRRSGSQHYTHNHLSSAYYTQLMSPLPKPTFQRVETYSPSEARPLPVAYYRYVEKSTEETEMEAEYDMDEEDTAWLEIVNQKRVSDGHASVSPDTFELLIDRLERESIVESRSQALSQSAIDEDAYCCVCLEDECLNSNVILFCDICNLAVHQECYGVPYIPEGQWLCRRCLQSPSRPVDCVLCPNRGGAFKQASDGSWAHVVCAIWIPEVCFANTVFLEPVEGVNNIPPARWKLICYLCKQRGRGASIQCHKTSCYRAFHVTCAQRAGLFMKIEPVQDTGNNTSFTVKKTAFCGNHSPLGAQLGFNEEHGGFIGGRGQRSYTLGPTVQQNQHGSKKGFVTKQKKTRKNGSVESIKSAVPLFLVPQIPSYRLNKICTGVPVQRKNQFMQRLHNYWLLKRHSRNGVPLIRQLYSYLQVQKIEKREPNAKVQALRGELKYWQKQRQDLEKARLLIELIRKRERLKREQLKLQQVTMELQLTPALVLLRSTLEQLQEKDTACIFISPVNLSKVPDYLEFVSEPMDFSTMREKLEAHKYSSVADLEADFNLMVSNCLRYNSSDTVYHKAAKQLKEVGGAILRHAQRQALSSGFDISTGMHLPTSTSKRKSSQPCWDKVDMLLDPGNCLHLSPETRLKQLLEKLDMVTSMCASGGRTKRLRLLRREINSLRRKLSCQRKTSRMLSGDIKMEDKREEDTQIEKNDYAPAIPGDAPPNSPVFCTEKGGMTTHGQLYKEQGNRSRGRGRGKVKSPSEVSAHTEGGDDKLHLKERHTLGLTNGLKKRGDSLTDSENCFAAFENISSSPPKVTQGRTSLNKERGNTKADSESSLKPLSLVWAKCRGYPSYPAMMVDPHMSKKGSLQNGIVIPVPPKEVLKLGERRQMETEDKLFLVLFFDTKRTWQWLPICKLHPMGIDDTVDKLRLTEGKKPNVRKSVHMAYERAMRHLRHVRSDMNFNPTSFI
ncbi:bromodomain and PHD finger-containing protein 3 isoform 2-T2 [Clarias gariepinus]|uniref:bromodomain and PHD finger-containing protein 3 isoform X2 n=1 Tax=Clarias gariepinus TaxID=13013 RepID=UPI00234DD44F|nr:bromodomain and PHD finger-containing protein 3 isoform X2 [Clarias gariepinus]